MRELQTSSHALVRPPSNRGRGGGTNVMRRVATTARLWLLAGLLIVLLGCVPKRYSVDTTLSHRVDRVVEKNDGLYVIGSIVPNCSFENYGIGVREAVALPSGRALQMKSAGFVYVKGQHWFVRFETAPPCTKRVRLTLALGPRASILGGEFAVTQDEQLWLESSMDGW